MRTQRGFASVLFETVMWQSKASRM